MIANLLHSKRIYKITHLNMINKSKMIRLLRWPQLPCKIWTRLSGKPLACKATLCCLSILQATSQACCNSLTFQLQWISYLQLLLLQTTKFNRRNNNSSNRNNSSNNSSNNNSFSISNKWWKSNKCYKSSLRVSKMILCLGWAIRSKYQSQIFREPQKIKATCNQQLNSRRSYWWDLQCLTWKILQQLALVELIIILLLSSTRMTQPSSLTGSLWVKLMGHNSI